MTTELLAKIEILREAMHNLGITKGISHPEVLKISQQIDVLINEYYKLNSKRP